MKVKKANSTTVHRQFYNIHAWIIKDVYSSPSFARGKVLSREFIFDFHIVVSASYPTRWQKY